MKADHISTLMILSLHITHIASTQQSLNDLINGISLLNYVLQNYLLCSLLAKKYVLKLNISYVTDDLQGDDSY